MLPELQGIAPGIEIEVLAAHRISDLQRREADIAARQLRPVQSELIGRQVGEWRARLYAAKAYLDRRGRPMGAEDLAGHGLLGFAPVERLLAILNAFGLPVTRRNVRHVTDNGLVLAGMAERGLGVSMMPSALAKRMVGLEPVLPDWPGIQVPLWLVALREVQTSCCIRPVVDFLAEAPGSGSPIPLNGLRHHRRRWENFRLIS